MKTDFKRPDPKYADPKYDPTMFYRLSLKSFGNRHKRKLKAEPYQSRKPYSTLSSAE